MKGTPSPHCAPTGLEGASIEVGTGADYARLAHHHYRAGPPATMVHVLRASIDGMLAGVLVVSMPARNASWRGIAWPDLFCGPDRREDLRQLNTHVRCISRVIVETRFRGLGLGFGLVRAYLHAPLTGRTEAIASMGGFCGFFARAGMNAIVLPVPPGDERLLEALRACGMSHTHLMTIAGREHALTRPELVRELRLWVRSRSTLRDRAGESPAALALLAAQRILPRRMAYVWTRPGEPERGELSMTPSRTVPRERAPCVPLIVMLTPHERRACVRALGARHVDRRDALLQALGLNLSPGHAPGGQRAPRSVPVAAGSAGAAPIPPPETATKESFDPA